MVQNWSNFKGKTTLDFLSWVKYSGSIRKLEQRDGNCNT